jgi:hypothetical protein
MGLFTTCNSGNVHFPTAKQYRSYYDVKDEIKCPCIKGSIVIDPQLWDNKCPYKIGEHCKKCGAIYRHPKNWTMKCSVCKPKGGE